MVDVLNLLVGKENDGNVPCKMIQVYRLPVSSTLLSPIFDIRNLDTSDQIKLESLENEFDFDSKCILARG